MCAARFVPPLGHPVVEKPLFNASTISKDDTRGAAASEQRILQQGARVSVIHPVVRHPPPWQNPMTGKPPQPGRPPSPDDPAEAHAKLKSQQSQDWLGFSQAAQNGLGQSSDVNQSTEKASEWREELRSRRESGLSSLTESPPSQGSILTSTVVHHNPAQEEQKSSMAAVLGSVADKYLNLDILDQDATTSQYVAFLLDMIHKLQARLEFQKRASKSVDASDNLRDAIATDPVNMASRYLVLHRVFCETSWHEHDRMVYEDVPKLAMQCSGLEMDEEILSGEKEIQDVPSFLGKQRNVHFVIFKEYRCGHSSSWWSGRKALTGTSPPGRFFARNKSFTSISPRHERLKVVSPLLSKALNAVAEFKQDIIEFDDPCEDSEEMEAPYNFLFHHRTKLLHLARNSPTHKEPVELLLEYLSTNYSKEYQEAEQLFAEGRVTENSIEKLFRPNQIVVTRNDDTYDAYVLDEWPIKVSNKLMFSAWRWSYNGRYLERSKWFNKLSVNFLDDREIKSLDICPVDYVEPQIKRKLLARGQQFWALKQHRLVSYNGWDRYHNFSYSNERFMVDMATYTKMHPSSLRPPWPAKDLEFDSMPEKIARDEDLTEEQLLLLPSTTHGYSLREKKWVSINIEQMSDVTWNKKAFKRLVLEEETKDLVRALIDVRMSDTKKLDDLVVGKGNGLIMLLHGSPGTGKTLTAESVAEFAEKPLYRVTCGDIGTDAQSVERYLETILYLAKIWDCVLLLDEADVFLEERSVSDLQRNSLVSVFLRVLEYYEGIMILTSNRVGTFDEAFQSRIRVAVRYEPLTLKSRKAIWHNFFEMIEDDDDEIKVNIRDLEGRLDELANYKMNGRQIRNVLLTARQIALHREESLEWKHLNQVVKQADNFNKYLKDIKGVSDETWAKSQSLR